MPPWDFRCERVLSISASGHKFGQSCCGTGWVLWRERDRLSEYVAVEVPYMGGGTAFSHTLNFSRPASGVYVQYYNFLRLGLVGYGQLCANMMSNAAFIRRGLAAMTHHGQARFVILDDGDHGCLPVVAARLNPALGLVYDDTDLQHALNESRWYVGAYHMSFKDPSTDELKPLFCDQPTSGSMFRIVVKANLTKILAINLLEAFKESLSFLDEHALNYKPTIEKKKVVVAGVLPDRLTNRRSERNSTGSDEIEGVSPGRTEHSHRIGHGVAC